MVDAVPGDGSAGDEAIQTSGPRGVCREATFGGSAIGHSAFQGETGYSTSFMRSRVSLGLKAVGRPCSSGPKECGIEPSTDILPIISCFRIFANVKPRG